MKNKIENENRNPNRDMEKYFWTAIICCCMILAILFFSSFHFANENQIQNCETGIENEIMDENSEIGIEVSKNENLYNFEIQEYELFTLEENPVFDEPSSPFPDLIVAHDEPMELTEQELHEITAVLACECTTEPTEGQYMVAQSFKNIMIRNNFSVQQARNFFDGYNPSLEKSHPDIWEKLESIVVDVFENGNLVTDEFVCWFYNPSLCKSGWHESQKFVDEIGGHRFFAPL